MPKVKVSIVISLLVVSPYVNDLKYIFWVPFTIGN